MRITAILASLALLGHVSIAAGAAGWGWEQGQSTYFAKTSNSDGAVFGQACYPEERKCSWVLELKRSCESSAKYPILVNSDAGARSLQITCAGPSADGAYRYVISEFDEIDSVVSGATRLGFALPLKGDRFDFVAFDLNGSTPAVTAMRRAAEAKMQALAPR